MRVVVLGCGPAGLMAAHAAANAGASDLIIISNKRKSELFGAQYLHAPIPGITPDDERPLTIKYQLQGSVTEYRHKVYGPMWDGTVSPEDLDDEHPAWDIRAAYDRLWSAYGDLVHDAPVSPAMLAELAAIPGNVVISTVPRDRLCVRGHSFGYTNVYAAGDAPSRGITLPYSCPAETVLLNGTDDVAWYRMSNIYGHKTVEWPGSMRSAPPVATTAAVRKPTFTNCDCHPGVEYAGRYGTWAKGVLAHQAYYNTLDLLRIKSHA